MAVGALGAWATAGYFAAGSVAAAMVGGAIVGAVVGGLYAAVTGGNILEGVLFGAVGGAVIGGVAAFASGGALTGTSGFGGGGSAASTTVIGAEGGIDVSASMMAGLEAEGAASAAGGAGSTVANMAAGGSFLSDITGSVAGGAADAYAASEAAKAKSESDAKASELAHTRSMQKLKFQAANQKGSGSDGAALSYKARMSELDQRKVEFKAQNDQRSAEWRATEKAAADRKSLFGRGGGSRTAGTSSAPTTARGGILEQRQGTALAGISGGRPITRPEEVA